jgi:hypothetical protein
MGYFKKQKRAILLVLILVINAVLGFYIMYPVSLFHDPAMHSEIVYMIREQGYPTTWQPFAENEFTYPPLFHYLSLFVSVTGISLIDSVRLAGILFFLLIPISMYLYLSSFKKIDKNIPIMSAAGIAFMPLVGNIFLLGEFPQVLAMALIILMLYTIKTERHLWTALITGLVVLAHPFMFIAAIILFLYNLKNMKSKGIKIILLYFLIAILVSCIWLPGYLGIYSNAASGQWQNAVYNLEQPFFWFWPSQDIIKFLFDWNFLTPVILPLSVIGFIKTKNSFLRSFFLLCFAFTVFHLPFTQLKIYDLFAIPSVIMAAFGVNCIFQKTSAWKNPIARLSPIIIFILLMGIFQVAHFVHAKNNWTYGNETPDPALIQSAIWLNGYDSSFVRIYSTDATEWVGILSNKMPLNPSVSSLEAYSDEYKRQLEANNKIRDSIRASDTETLKSVLEEWNLKYLIVKEDFLANYLKKINDSDWKVYEVI